MKRAEERPAEKWAQEPWKADGDWVRNGRGGALMVTPRTGAANVARAVECVNACAGLNPAAIPLLVDAVKQMIGVHDIGEAEGSPRTVEELRAALAALQGEEK